LLDVAVGRARVFGRGGNIADIGSMSIDMYPDRYREYGGLMIVNAKVYMGDPLDPIIAEISVLAPPSPELADVYRLVEYINEAYEDYKWFKRFYEGVDVARERHAVSFELLPVELQIALKKVVETIITIVLSATSAGRKHYSLTYYSMSHYSPSHVGPIVDTSLLLPLGSLGNP
jgi:hypothetical protein